MRTLIKNGKLITPNQLFEGGLIIKDGKIEEIFQGQIETQDFDNIIDAEGRYISPGFIDIHTHGAGDCDFMDGTSDAILNAVKKHAQFGTTTIVPTTLTSTFEDLMNTFDNFKKAKEVQKFGPELLGLHLEGPYFSMEQKGAQDPKYIKNPDKEEYEKILSYSDDIVRWTIAPELEGACEMASNLRKRGIVASMGHSNAIYEEALRGYESGFSLITHFYSGMSSVRRINAYRYSGLVETGYLVDDLYVEVIADGKHLPESLLKLIYKIKGPDKICLVTDSMRAAGMGSGKSILGGLKNGQEIIVEDGIAKLLDRTAFAGSVATADRLVRTMVKIAKVPLNDAIKMITMTPAKVMNIDDQKGSLTKGKDADIVMFNDDIEVSFVMAKGNVLKG